MKRISWAWRREKEQTELWIRAWTLRKKEPFNLDYLISE